MRGLAAGIVVYQQGAQALQFRDRLKSEARLFGEDGVRLKFGNREPIVRASGRDEGGVRIESCAHIDWTAEASNRFEGEA